MSLLHDKELQQYRDLVKPPGVFQDGFGWKAVFGALFVGIVMLPASMYMNLVIGGSSIGPAATWVTVILFMEMAKRARTALSTAELFVIMSMAGALTGGPIEGFFWRQYIVQSEAARSYGMSDMFPAWFSPGDPNVLDQRDLFMWPWLIPLVLVFVQMVISAVDNLVLGYGLFRLVSDVEKLPFPMAPLGATGVLALSENQSGNEGWRWRCFSIGTAFGLFFGFLYAAIPTLTSTFLREPFQLFPIPWLDISTRTQNWLPAVPMGITFDLGLFFFGMALPFFGVIGSVVGVVVMVIANPILWYAGMLPSWKKGMLTQEILFANG
ncbi:MAG TPA: peptide transporter, partial [Planctomycetota bacterium]|nr:peptide transporter [Planctomycetota bacterium]